MAPNNYTSSSKLILEYQDKFNLQLNEFRRLCYITRAKEVQVEFKKKLVALHSEAQALKKNMVSLKDENAANALLSFELISSAFIKELDMWIALKEDKPSEAWNALIESQELTRSAMVAHVLANKMSKYEEYLLNLEKMLFPPQIFFSPGMISLESKCSICDKDYEDCDHIAGKPYMGEFCARIHTKVDLLEISIVDNPAHKTSRGLTFTENGKQIDTMTLREIKPKK